MTVAEVDEKVRLRSVETWFDPMEMFRQIAPDGIVNREIVSSKAPREEAVGEPVNDGVMIADLHHHSSGSAHLKDSDPASVIPKTLSRSTGLPADANVPQQGVKTATTHQTKANGASLKRPADALDPTQTLGSSMATGHVNDHHSTPTLVDSGHVSDGSDKTWEKKGDAQHQVPKALLDGDFPRDMEDSVAPGPGEAVVVPANSQETRMTHEEMSNISPAQCPFLMNRE